MSTVLNEYMMMMMMMMMTMPHSNKRNIYLA